MDSGGLSPETIGFEKVAANVSILAARDPDTIPQMYTSH